MDCPFINANDPRCSRRLNIQRLEDAFELCTNHYRLCPLYHELSGEDLALACAEPQAC